MVLISKASTLITTWSKLFAKDRMLLQWNVSVPWLYELMTIWLVVGNFCMVIRVFIKQCLYTDKRIII